MKKYAKEIMLVLVTVIITSTISVYATVYYNSENITYTPTNTDWNVTNTSAALNDLYSFTGKGNASASNILTGKTALVGGQLITGTMANNEAISKTIAPGGSYTIPVGFHNGSGKVTASTGGGNATASNILTGKTALVGGKLITGTMKNNGAISKTIAPGGSYTIPAGFHNGSGKVIASPGGSEDNKYILIKENRGLRTTYSYTISKADLAYKQILVFVSAANFSEGSAAESNAYATITNNNITKIVNSTYTESDGGVYMTNNVYIGIIDNVIENDVISIYGFWGFYVKIIGVK